MFNTLISSCSVLGRGIGRASSKVLSNWLVGDGNSLGGFAFFIGLVWLFFKYLHYKGTLNTSVYRIVTVSACILIVVLLLIGRR